MLRLNELKNLPVYTKSGKHLGRIIDVEFDPSSQMVWRYHVGRWPGLTGLWKGRLLITREQVVAISKDAMVVEDSIGQAKAVAAATPVVG
ncbi:TPA: hypothetical protein DIC39_02235 [Patescibacteria group bacterium]|nr:hypothetical protein [Patescibacteria group bacterium]HCU47853.1 hypothetical protein [Patescibacteria group bacterium]